MPLMWAHSLYWATTVPPEPDVPNYPIWQIVPISGGSGEPPPVRVRSWWQRQWKGIVRHWHEIGRRIPERLYIAWVLFCILFGSSYHVARYAVRKVAVDPSMPRGPLAYQHMQNRSALYHYQGENVVRSMEAAEWMGHWLSEKHRKVPMWRRHMACELAYLALKERGR